MKKIIDLIVTIIMMIIVVFTIIGAIGFILKIFINVVCYLTKNPLLFNL